MTSPSNPFVYDQPVSDGQRFIGREAIINHCYDCLASPTPAGIAISGEYGLGKTSLLRHLTYLAQKEGWGPPYTHNIFICYLDCSTIKELTPTDFWRKVLDSLKEAKEDPALHQKVDKFLAQPKIEANDFKHLLRWLNGQQLAPALALDEFDSIVKLDTADRVMAGDFLSSLRNLTNLPNYPLRLITASRESLNILCYDLIRDQPRAHFYDNFTFEHLTPFTADEINNLFEQASKAGIDFDQADRDLLERLAGAHPALLQLASYHLFEARRQTLSTDQTYEEVPIDFQAEAQDYFVRFWSAASPLEQGLLSFVIIAYLPGKIAGQFKMADKDIQILLQSYERYLARLVERGLLKKREDGYQIFSPVFARWIGKQIAAESEASLADRYLTISEAPLRRAMQTLKKQASQLTLDKLTLALIWRSAQLNLPAGFPEDRYIPQEELGRGNFGVVYKAFDTNLYRLVAIKVLHSQSTANHVSLLKEAKAVGALKHDNIVVVHDVRKTNNLGIFLVMEYLDGQTLTKLLQKKQRLPLQQVIDLVKQAAAGLDYAHTKGRIHRDIKPENLFVTVDGKLKLTDFGIAKIIGDKSSREGFHGSLPYMSPEQIDDKELDGRSDFFSLAVVTFEMLSGTSPWPGPLITSITQDPPRSLTDFNVPDAARLDPIFQTALAKNPSDRYQSGADFIQALQEVVESKQKPELTDDYSEIKEQQALILQALQDQSNEQAKQMDEVNKLRAWMQHAQEFGLPANPELLAKLQALAKPTGTVEIGFPFIFGVNYNVPFDKKDMIAIWKRLSERFRQFLNKSAKSDRN